MHIRYFLRYFLRILSDFWAQTFMVSVTNFPRNKISPYKVKIPYPKNKKILFTALRAKYNKSSYISARYRK